ncbi:hypothetical protein QQ045_012594 [Rhodiola kirilowii]
MANTVFFIFNLLCFNIICSSHAQKELPKLKGTVKTIHTESDVIDCVDIYQQPAFDHPLLRNHNIEKMPSQNIEIQYYNISKIPMFYQTWHETGQQCPEGTVPIRRSGQVDQEVIMKMKGGSVHNNVSRVVNNHNFVYEHAVMRVDKGTYYGTRFGASVWNPHVELNDISLAQTMITAGPPNTMNTIEVGWMVNHQLYKDSRTRFFIFWTTDGYNTLCYNLQCPGFVQISRSVIPGSSLPTISQYGSTNHDLLISVYKAGPNWWLQVEEEHIGYWPAEIFPLLSNSADYVEWGGKVLYKNSARNHHTTTQMGSGHFAAEKYTKAAMFHNLQVTTRDDNPNFHRPAYFHPWGVINSNCYSLLKAKYDHNNHYGDHFFYGGPGYSPSCP